MIVDKYLVINNRGAIAVREREPRLGGNEIALRLRLEIPNALFERPRLVAEMKVPATAVPKSSITVDVTDNIEKIIKDATGLTMNVSVVEHEEEEK